jgi:hypothetical protein
MRSWAHGWGLTAERVAIDLATPVLFLAISVGVIALLMIPATRRDFRSSSDNDEAAEPFSQVRSDRGGQRKMFS